MQLEMQHASDRGAEFPAAMGGAMSRAAQRDASPGELARLATLEACAVLDTPPEPHFDDLARLAARLCETPMALVSLVDDHRQWFKSAVGLDVCETPREIAFCAHTIACDGLFEVADALNDPRFAGNPLVTGSLGLRFYAAVPLEMEGGHKVGTLAVLDKRPRRLTPTQRRDLALLARQVVVLLEERRQRRRAQAATAAVRRQADSLLAIAGRVARLGAWELDVATEKVVWSDVVAEIHAMPIGHEPSLGPALAFYEAGDRVVLTQAVSDCREQGTPFDLELRLHPADGSRRWVRAIGEAERDSTGRITHLRGACQDITERKESEARQAQLDSRLRQAQKMESIGTLAAGIAHEFNNVLGSVLGQLTLARAALPLASGAEPALATIEASAQRARALVQQLLAFGNQQSIPLTQSRQLLLPLVEEAVRLVASSLPATAAIDVIRPAHEIWIDADKGQLQQLVINLCTNAWQALPDGEGCIEVGLGIEPPTSQLRSPDACLGTAAGMAHLWVSDDGCGIAAEYLHRIFEPFFTTRPLGHGSGLGLSVAHGIAAAHGGSIRVDTRLAHGSTFHVTLPMARRPAAVKTASTALSLRGLRVLCVDDDPVMLLTLQALLERASCSVKACPDPLLALRSLQTDASSIELLVTDYNMPGMDGLQLIGHARQILPALPIVLTSGYLDDSVRDRAGRLGVQAIVPKERVAEDLVAAVRQAARLVAT